LPARVGIEIAELTAELAASLGMSQPRGGVVREVRPGSPAETAGLRPNDVIVAVNGRPVYDSQALARTLSLLVADRPAALTVIRARREFQLTVTPAAAAGER
jgi:serine protease Do